MCKYQKKSSITTKFDAHRPAVNFTERSFGSFSYQLEFYQSDSFENMQNPNSYPLEYNVGETIYMEIASVNIVQNIEVFLESCVAAPNDDPNPISYPIITDEIIIIIMSVSAALSALLLLASTASVDGQPFKRQDYFGSLLTYNPRKNPDGSYLVDIRFKETHSFCDMHNYWTCTTGVEPYCSDKTAARGLVDSNSYGGSWCQIETVMKITVSDDTPFTLEKNRCCWINGGSILFVTNIGLEERSDTSKPNRSPVVTTLPSLRVPQNCARNYNLLSFDPDHDQVRCRYGNASANECGNCKQHAEFTLDQSTCTLSFANPQTGIYVFELVMEDYPTKSITLNNSIGVTSDIDEASPLSKIPIQFTLKVEDPAPSCTEGEYIPRFIHPTPHHGEHLKARVNQELEIRVKVTATYSSQMDFLFSGPLNSKKEIISSGEYVINWTPNSEEYGQHFPICFISEMRCVIVVVEPEGPKTQVNCTKDTMSVSIERANILRILGDHLRVNNNASCTVSSNSTHLFTTFSLNGCGTQIEETDEHLIFKNTIVAFENPNDVVTRKDDFEIEVMCKYQKKSSITTKFDAHRPAVNFTEKGFGSFSYQLEFYQSDSFENMQNPSSYPLEYNVGETIYMEIASVNIVQNIEVFLESCVAAPNDDPNYPISYPIITDGCVVDETVHIQTSHESNVKFSIEAFKFIGQYDQVFITCSIILCQANNPNTRCAKGCTNNFHNVRKREAAIQTGSHFISQGPLRLRRSTSLTEAISPSLNLNLVFVAGCVVAVVAMVCGMMVYKSRGSKVNYQLLKSDNF
ncbi:hypothetical protein Q8A67_024138 [Cirrhinus molitorella]|uniref:ZP domain-containing protein n=1 Tax=Cirrhinus molitorella TaxID=172907 RepID=A0AA88T976_9TELE|nr:hypothetical protein Q8A67_024138 [Cirrhinus molitorella]